MLTSSPRALAQLFKWHLLHLPLGRLWDPSPSPYPLSLVVVARYIDLPFKKIDAYKYINNT